MPPSAPLSFGVHVVSPTRYRAYKNGVIVQECGDHPDRTSNTLVAILALATVGFRVGRFEARTAPGGTLLASDDFNGTAGTVPAGWSQHHGDGSLDGAGNLLIYGGDFSAGVYRTIPAGAMFFELQNVVFDDESHGPHWGMVAAYWNGGDYGDQSYRVLSREQTPHDTTVLDCTPGRVGGVWTIGTVGMGV